ncbi:PaaI family thioesterase [Caldichromatium japonicum]|uniref:PaaI family thioesterase n=1 Tax=Caldichromatium japonicum TaxID=2699430 RepID=A0A6G7VGR6_9GAMM|nr:PaaI family thioesterase [Caldichromatium japonicum]QIK39038.1 PaaI family thioesterase [Caldichromatium japonicum]
MELVEVSAGRARAQLRIAPHHFNAVGLVHGAAIFSLADLVFAVASNAHGTVALGLNVAVSFMKAVRSGVLTAEAEEVSCNPRLVTYLIRVTDETGAAIALMQGAVYRKQESLADHVRS